MCHAPGSSSNPQKPAPVVAVSATASAAATVGNDPPPPQKPAQVVAVLATAGATAGATAAVGNERDEDVADQGLASKTTTASGPSAHQVIAPLAAAAASGILGTSD